MKNSQNTMVVSMTDVDIKKLSDRQLTNLIKLLSKRGDIQGVRAKVIVSEEIDRREKRRKKK